MATKTVNQPDKGSSNAGATLPEFLTDERIHVSLYAVHQAQGCAWGALEVLDARGEHEREVLRALLLRIAHLTVCASVGLGDGMVGQEELQRRLDGEVC